ncbi:MAG: thioredoxin family protein [Chthonomonadales bacterium]
MKSWINLILAAAALSVALPAVAAAADSPVTTAIALKSAVAKARKEKKVVFVKFEATWCGWCHKLTDALNVPENKEIFDKYFVLLRLDVMENGPKKSEENPGGVEYMKELGGEKSGLPFYAFLDDKGKKVADSNVMPKDQNIGYPGEDGEIVAFEALLKKANKKISDGDMKKLMTWFKEHKPKTN